MSIPRVNQQRTSNLRYSNAKPRYTEPVHGVVHIELKIFFHTDETSLNWIVDTSIDFNPYPLYCMIP